MLFNKPNLSKQNTFAAAMLLISVLAMYNWFISPNTRYLSAAQKYRQKSDLAEKQGKLINSELQQRQQKLDELTQQFEQQKKEFFEPEQAKSFISNLQSSAEQNGCLVTNFNLSPIKNVVVKDNNSLDINQYQIVMNLMGNYANIVKYLKILQSRPARVWVDSIDVGMKNAASGYLGCNITLSIYALKAKENINNVKNK